MLSNQFNNDTSIWDPKFGNSFGTISINTSHNPNCTKSDDNYQFTMYSIGLLVTKKFNELTIIFIS